VPACDRRSCPRWLRALRVVLPSWRARVCVQVQLEPNAPSFDAALDQVAACQLAAHLQQRLAAYK
jgi:hypothetical protein